MGAVSTLPGFLDALRTKLIALDGLSGVNVFTGPVDDLSAGEEAIVFAVDAPEADYDLPTMTQVETLEEYEVEGRTWVVKPGAGETVIKAARDRCFALLEQVHDYIASLTSTAAFVSALTVDKVAVTGWRMEQYPGDGYRDCRLSFTLHVKAHFTPA